MAAETDSNWECCLNESPTCRLFTTPEELIEHLFSIHGQYLCYICHYFVTQVEDEYVAHIAAHEHENKSDSNNNQNNGNTSNNVKINDKDDKSGGSNNKRVAEVSEDDQKSKLPRQTVSTNANINRTPSSKQGKKRNNNQLERNESCPKSTAMDEETAPILQPNPPFVSPRSKNNSSRLQPELIPVSRIQPRSQNLRQTRLNSPLVRPEKTSVTDEQMMMDTSPIPETPMSNQCGTCEKTFKTEIDLATHLLSHNAETLNSSRSSSCLSESKSSITEEDVVDEDPKDDDGDDQRIYCCPVCGRKEYKEKELFLHFSAKHKNPENRTYGCPGSKCSRTFKNVDHLYQHVKKDHDEKSTQTRNSCASTNNTPFTTIAASIVVPNIISPKKRGRKKKSTSPITKTSSTTTTRTRSTTHDDRNDKNDNDYTTDSDTSTNERKVKRKSENMRTRNRNIESPKEIPVISQREKRAIKKTVPPVTRSPMKGKFPCGDDCPAKYSDLKELHLHRQEKHPEKTFHVCVKCNYIPYSSLSGLQKHQSEHQ